MQHVSSLADAHWWSPATEHSVLCFGGTSLLAQAQCTVSQMYGISDLILLSKLSVSFWIKQSILQIFKSYALATISQYIIKMSLF